MFNASLLKGLDQIQRFCQENLCKSDQLASNEKTDKLISLISLSAFCAPGHIILPPSYRKRRGSFVSADFLISSIEFLSYILERSQASNMDILIEARRKPIIKGVLIVNENYRGSNKKSKDFFFSRSEIPVLPRDASVKKCHSLETLLLWCMTLIIVIFIRRKILTEETEIAIRKFRQILFLFPLWAFIRIYYNFNEALKLKMRWLLFKNINLPFY